MDEIPVHQLRFEFGAIEGRNPVWSHSNPDFAMFINALGVHVPHFERFLVRVMRAYRDGLLDRQLLDDVQAIIGQESHHASNFINWTQALAAKYLEIAEVDHDACSFSGRSHSILPGCVTCFLVELPSEKSSHL